jgi:hypothetical protein
MYDVFFLTMGEPRAWENLHRLKEKSNPKVVSDVLCYYNAHKACADQSSTDMFYVVDADAWIVDNFEFNYTATEERVHVWRSINPINNLKYGHGAVKLFPKKAFTQVEPKVDITTGLGGIFAVQQISNEHRFDYEAYNTWRTAFRECVKLSSKAIEFQIEIATNYRLAVWCNMAKPYHAYSQLALQGARAGRDYGETNKGNIEALQLVNNSEWLKEQYDTI